MHGIRAGAEPPAEQLGELEGTFTTLAASVERDATRIAPGQMVTWCPSKLVKRNVGDWL